MSSSEEERPAESYFIAGEDWLSYRAMNRESRYAEWYLERSFQHTGSRDRDLERMALWSSLLLDKHCALALQPDHAARLWPPVSAGERYDLQTGIRAVHATLPFSAEEREALSAPLPESSTSFTEHGETPGLEYHEPELVKRWQNWLWIDELGLPQTSPEALGPSLILLEGCKRVIKGLQEIMDNPLYDP